MIQIIPGPLSKTYNEIVSYIEQSEDVVERFHVDIVDCVFADNQTVLPEDLQDIHTRLFLDYHLMVKEPIDWVDRSINGHADRIIGHIEMMGNQVEFVHRVTEEGFKVGLAIDIDTPVLAIEPDILGELDVVLIMCVKAGFGGQKFQKDSLKKIEEVAKLRQKENAAFYICVDGGETLETVGDVYKAGSDEVVIGKRLFDGDFATNRDRFLEAAYAGPAKDSHTP